MRRPYRLIVFDLDGTLVDSSRDLADSVNEFLRASGARALPEDAVVRMVGGGAATLVRSACTAAGIEPPPDALGRFLAIYDTRLLQHTRAYPGTAAALAKLAAYAPLGVLTNKPIAATRAILAGLDLARYFPDDAVIGGDGPFPRKPDPASLRHLHERAAVAAADTLLVGDSAIDWQTARNAAASVCLARYGFGFAGFPASDLGPADLAIDAPLDLLPLLGL